MVHFRVLLNGQNFWLEVEGRPKRMGFFTVRFVQGQDKAEAEQIAVAALASEGKLTLLNGHGDPPRVLVHEIQEVEELDVPAVTRGFVFYPDE